MQKLLIISLIIVTALSFCNPAPVQKNNPARQIPKDSILKIEMNLSAFGVESDNFPSIKAYVDLVHDSSNCTKSYYNPEFKGSTYHLSQAEIKKVSDLLRNCDLQKLKDDYSVGESDQPTSTITIYTGKRRYIIKDYGLEGEYPLQELYKIVYKY